MCSRRIEVPISGAQSHNPIRADWRYHAPLRTIHQNAGLSEPNLSIQLTLKLAVKAVNDSIGSKSLVPSLIAIGVLSRSWEMNSEIPSRVERMRALEMTELKMETISASKKSSVA